MIKAGLKLLALAGGVFWATSPATAATTVECHSVNYQYTECSAGSLSKPQLVHQISSSSCVLNRTWGYNPRSGYLWVAQGCAGVFADVGGYHYGRGDGYDSNARMYNEHGHDVGAAVGGAIIGALIEGMVTSKHGDYQHETSNYSGGHYSARTSSGSRYNGCHGVGCLVSGDSPPEPGQSEFRGSSDYDSPPEPGQQEMSGPES
ncbi:DUF3011 domain-containing protein [Sandaracinobacter sp. RS1-74]|uniref:DUF3011 domain-containing protein n=1 Tax=Sandaracinobacteroides sayramensis TaxID=2913411 RepID=UPI001EDB85A4|nr:DUF3011 domain-containing protein [Sandaracinobacteroides sayramensis]MCG2839703.1 DUF3011 domain-containing protein [Sandaracinobacteroides sayramensis]